MKVLHLSNHYPPYHQGNTELQCHQFIEVLSRQGHRERVLTSVPPANAQPDDSGGEVFRELQIYTPEMGAHPPLATLQKIEQHNHQVLQRHLDEFRPEVIVIWSMQNLSLSMLLKLEETGLPVVYGFYNRWTDFWLKKDPWMAFWKGNVQSKLSFGQKLMRSMGMDKMVTKGIPTDSWRKINFRHAFFCSESFKKTTLGQGFALETAHIIPCAISFTDFAFRAERRTPARRLVYIDRLTEGKDTLTAIKAIKELRRMGHSRFSLDIYGRADRHYEKICHEFIRKSQLGGAVSIKSLDEEDLPTVMKDYDIVVVTVKDPEPFPLTTIKAMAVGLPVISTPSGANKEVITDGETGVLYRAGDAKDLAEKIEALSENAELMASIARKAREMVEIRYDIRRVAAELHAYLRDIVTGDDSAPTEEDDGE